MTDTSGALELAPYEEGSDGHYGLRRAHAIGGTIPSPYIEKNFLTLFIFEHTTWAYLSG